MIVQITKDGPKNCSVLVKGFASIRSKPEKVFDLNMLTPPGQGWKGLRLDSVVWLIEEKMGIGLWWGEGVEEKDLILPMESRNFLRTDEGIPSPRREEGWDGEIWMSIFRGEEAEKAYLFILDFDKQ